MLHRIFKLMLLICCAIAAGTLAGAALARSFFLDRRPTDDVGIPSRSGRVRNSTLDYTRATINEYSRRFNELKRKVKIQE